MKKVTFISLLILGSCLSLNHNETSNIYNESLKLILKDFGLNNIIVSDSIYFQNSSDFAILGYYTPEMEKEVSRLEKQDKKNYFPPYKNFDLYKQINYKTPNNTDGKPIAFFSKPINDSLIVEVYEEYQNSNSIKDYKLMGSRMFLLRKDGDSVKILKSFNKRR